MYVRALFAAALLLTAGPALAAVSEAEAAQLDERLTPVGAERAGNGTGTIPAWTGGIQKIPAGVTAGGHYPDPYAGENPRFTIDASNLDRHRTRLTPGQIALLQRHPTWKMRV